ncbi:hypothetical protein [Pyrococcus horikoshii]|uniref:CRISPR-associated protein CXXC-CXXC domain-containing protein n=1 Tax=Pyrococcus horikoshii (strain ATCC 700860 / DSM 12428 / JCM 9974 / NBRC 100139 / OT-3) TaxID=70601 RepID=O57908_PYRHO|nr:hypothetical protein [Pyrococcus horikoshii]BAA29238.1 431aa long hypothetical protein [Pyrococcus horikoshii OT3]
MVLTLVPYLKNGELFLKDLGISEINEEIIEEYWARPIEELTLNFIPINDEGEGLRVLKSMGFEVSVTSREIKSAFLKRTRGVCSICGREGEVVANRAFIYPFERKIDSIVNEKNRLSFCLEHAFKLYSAMANLFIVPLGRERLKFFFDAEEETLRRMLFMFKQFWRDRVEFEKGKVRVGMTLRTYNPNETFFSILHEFVKFLKRRRLLQEAIDLGKLVRVFLVYGTGQFYGSEVIEGIKLVELINFLSEIQEKGRETKKYKRQDSAVALFFENLSVPRGKDKKKNTLEREEFIRKLLDGKFDFILLNRIFMERYKRDLPLPFYYLTWVRAYFKAFGGDIVDLRTFERVNGLGYSLGKMVRGTNLEKYVWELFRARGFEEFVNKLVELQAKLEIAMDVRPIYENEKEWKTIKAILLNGMLNAIHGGEEDEGH